MEDLSSPQLAEFCVVDQSLEQLGLADLGAVAFGQVKVQIMIMALQESPDETNKRSFEVVAQANQLPPQMLFSQYFQFIKLLGQVWATM